MFDEATENVRNETTWISGDWYAVFSREKE